MGRDGGQQLERPQELVLEIRKVIYRSFKDCHDGGQPTVRMAKSLFMYHLVNPGY